MLLDRRFPGRGRPGQSLRAHGAASFHLHRFAPGRAVFILGSRSGRGDRQGPRVRAGRPCRRMQSGAFELSQRMAPLQGIELALRFLEDSEDGVRDRAAQILGTAAPRQGPRVACRHRPAAPRRRQGAGLLPRGSRPARRCRRQGRGSGTGRRPRPRGLEAMASVPEQRGWRLQRAARGEAPARARGPRPGSSGRGPAAGPGGHRGSLQAEHGSAPAPNVFCPSGAPRPVLHKGPPWMWPSRCWSWASSEAGPERLV